jgi:hypothetical protein
VEPWIAIGVAMVAALGPEVIGYAGSSRHRGAGVRFGAVLAKVQYPGRDGILRTILAQVPDDTPSPYTFTLRNDSTPLEKPITAELHTLVHSTQPGGDVAIYRATSSAW